MSLSDVQASHQYMSNLRLDVVPKQNYKHILFLDASSVSFVTFCYGTATSSMAKISVPLKIGRTCVEHMT